MTLSEGRPRVEDRPGARSRGRGRRSRDAPAAAPAGRASPRPALAGSTWRSLSSAAIG